MSTRNTTNPEDLLPFDPEIERTILAARRVVSLSHRINTELDTQLNSDSGHSDCVHSIDRSDCDSDSISDSLVSTNSDIMAGEQANHHTLKELVAPDVNYQPLCIQYPDLAANFELKSGLIHLLPKFHGLAGECPIKHLKEFHAVLRFQGAIAPKGSDLHGNPPPHSIFHKESKMVDAFPKFMHFAPKLLAARFEGGFALLRGNFSKGLGFAREFPSSFNIPQGIQNGRRFSQILAFPPPNWSRLVLKAVLRFQGAIAPKGSDLHGNPLLIPFSTRNPKWSTLFPNSCVSAPKLLAARFEGGFALSRGNCSKGLGFARESPSSFNIPQGIQNGRRFSQIPAFPPPNCSRLVLKAVLRFQGAIAPKGSDLHGKRPPHCILHKESKMVHAFPKFMRFRPQIARGSF
ncbi:hypothetical protein K1719_045878 [Acacia pycnantha]|nr:hypothetical protein K1719_045878 [Acacia pycnantha]